MASAAVAAACADEVMSGAGAPSVGVASPAASRTGVAAYYASKLDALQLALSEKAANLRRLEAQVREAARARPPLSPARARALPFSFRSITLPRGPSVRAPRPAPSRSARC